MRLNPKATAFGSFALGLFALGNFALGGFALGNIVAYVGFEGLAMVSLRNSFVLAWLDIVSPRANSQMLHITKARRKGKDYEGEGWVASRDRRREGRSAENPC